MTTDLRPVAGQDPFDVTWNTYEAVSRNVDGTLKTPPVLSSTLAAASSIGASSVTVTTALPVALLGKQFYVVIDAWTTSAEAALATPDVTGKILTLSRGGSTHLANAHSAGAAVIYVQSQDIYMEWWGTGVSASQNVTAANNCFNQIQYFGGFGYQFVVNGPPGQMPINAPVTTTKQMCKLQNLFLVCTTDFGAGQYALDTNGTDNTLVYDNVSVQSSNFQLSMAQFLAGGAWGAYPSPPVAMDGIHCTQRMVLQNCNAAGFRAGFLLDFSDHFTMHKCHASNNFYGYCFQHSGQAGGDMSFTKCDSDGAYRAHWGNTTTSGPAGGSFRDCSWVNAPWVWYDAGGYAVLDVTMMNVNVEFQGNGWIYFQNGGQLNSFSVISPDNNGPGGGTTGAGWNDPNFPSVGGCCANGQVLVAGCTWDVNTGGGSVFSVNPASTTATGVNALNSAVVNVGSTAGFPPVGSFVLAGSLTSVSYTGLTSTSFTGCGNHAATTGGESVAAWGYYDLGTGVNRWRLSGPVSSIFSGGFSDSQHGVLGSIVEAPCLPGSSGLGNIANASGPLVLIDGSCLIGDLLEPIRVSNGRQFQKYQTSGKPPTGVALYASVGAASASSTGGVAGSGPSTVMLDRGYVRVNVKTGNSITANSYVKPDLSDPGYVATVMALSPNNFWLIGETAFGQAAADLCGRQNGTYINTAGLAFTQTGIVGGSGATAVKFTAASQGYINLVTGPVAVGDTFTIEAWVKFATIGAAQTIFSGAGAMTFAVNSSGNVTAALQGSSAIVASTSSLSADGNFHHLVWTKATSTSKIYIDGTDVTGSVTNHTVSNASGYLLGVDFTGSLTNYLNGTMQFIALYPTALSSGNVSANYAAGTTSTTGSSAGHVIQASSFSDGPIVGWTPYGSEATFSGYPGVTVQVKLTV